MKKVLIVAAAASLMSLAACQPAATNNTVDVGNEANAAAFDAAAANEAEANVVDGNVVAPVTNEGEATNTM